MLKMSYISCGAALALFANMFCMDHHKQWHRGYDLQTLATITDTRNPRAKVAREFYTSIIGSYKKKNIIFESKILYLTSSSIELCELQQVPDTIFLATGTGVYTKNAYDIKTFKFDRQSHQKTTSIIDCSMHFYGGPDRLIEKRTLNRDSKGSYILINNTKHHLCTSRGSKIFGLAAVHLQNNLAIACTEKNSFWRTLFNYDPERKWYLFTTTVADDAFYDRPTATCIMKPLYPLPELDKEKVQNLMFMEDGNTILVFLYDGRILKITPQVPLGPLKQHHKPRDVFFRWK